ncbi:hypothetical protein [Dysgonomonas capnocytophagoides]|uniref:hypothetical protein n=1 Tax=Dysgonomonas capnocytophagoides TaxID=45254 RepID=UPI000417EECE|nr:hypothetical protein [Dysgonomonas capnocytophagoides]
MKNTYLFGIVVISILLSSCDQKKNNTDRIDSSIIQEDKKTEFANNIAKYVYIERGEYGDVWILHNGTNYTLDKVIAEFSVKKDDPSSRGSSLYYDISIEINYISANTDHKITKGDILKEIHPALSRISGDFLYNIESFRLVLIKSQSLDI